MPFRTAGIAVSLLVCFLTASLAPCPARVEAGHAHGHPAEPAQSASTEGAQAAHAAHPDAALSAACPCGCERASLAGSSARLGVALPSSPQTLVLPGAVELSAAPVVRRVELFALRIEHVPLRASL